MAEHLKPSNAATCISVDSVPMGFCYRLCMHLCVCARIHVFVHACGHSGGQLVGACSLVCGTHTLTHES